MRIKGGGGWKRGGEKKLAAFIPGPGCKLAGSASFRNDPQPRREEQSDGWVPPLRRPVLRPQLGFPMKLRTAESSRCERGTI